MTIRRIAMQAATANLTPGKSTTVDANGLLIDGVVPYTSDGIDVAIIDGGTGSSTAAAARLALGMVDALDRVPIANGGTGSSTASAARLALGLMDANDRMLTAMLPTKILSSYWHASWNEKTLVQGGWDQNAVASQTDFDDVLLSAAGYIRNTTNHANNDEIHFGNLVFNAGTYKVQVVYVKSLDVGILEVLHGTTSLGTADGYAAVSYNNVATFIYSPATRVTGNLRLKCTGKNGSSSNYYIAISRIEIIRTG